MLKSVYIRYTPLSLSFVNGETNQVLSDIPREHSAISSKDSYLDFNLNVNHKASSHARYSDGDH